MQAGQRDLAVHPRCGTNVVTAGFLSGVLALMGILVTDRRAPWYMQLPNAILGAMIGALLAHPVGAWMQAKVTTSAEMDGVRVRDIRNRPAGRMTAYFVETDHTPSP